MDCYIFSPEIEDIMNYRYVPTFSVKFYNFYSDHLPSPAHLPRVTILKILGAIPTRLRSANTLS